MIKYIFQFLLYSILLTLFASCNRLDLIDYSPKLTPENFLATQHWMKINFAGLNFILSQPSSSVIVYFVSFFDVYVAYKFITESRNQKSKLWWGIGLMFTGVGAILAGTSYQAFGYEIKCTGKEICTWTSWWEIIYALLSGLGMNGFLISSAHSNATGSFRKSIIVYAILNSIIYSSLLLYGAFAPIQFLVSFEFLSLASTPSVFFFIWLYGRAYTKTKSNMNLYLRNVWIILIAIIFTYAISLVMGITNILWQKGIWFTENDVLHVGMIYWIYYIWKKLPNEFQDTLETQS